MQLFGWDSRTFLVSAGQARKGMDYWCPECGGRLRVRGGGQTKAHFFHVGEDRICRQRGKSAYHLLTQLWLQEKIGKDNLALEIPFPQVGRIADAVWFSERLIFEVQCSPISVTEVEERNLDYASQGYQVVWVLHDVTFNKVRCSPVENFLAFRWRYFSCIDERGRGTVYDQMDWIEDGTRRAKVGPFPLRFDVKRIDPRTIYPLWKSFFHRRLWVSHRCLEGDVLATVAGMVRVERVENALNEWKELRKGVRRRRAVRVFIQWLRTCTVIPYRILIQILLETTGR